MGVSLEANICFGFQGIEDDATRQVWRNWPKSTRSWWYLVVTCIMYFMTLWRCFDMVRVWYIYIYIRSTPHPVIVTTRIITFLVGNPYKPSFATVTGWGVDPIYIIYIYTCIVAAGGCWKFPRCFRACFCVGIYVTWSASGDHPSDTVDFCEDFLGLKF